MGYYIIQIEIDNQQHFSYVTVGKNRYAKMGIVTAKHNATRFPTEGIADICSTYFWENYWKGSYSTRQIVYVKERTHESRELKMLRKLSAAIAPLREGKRDGGSFGRLSIADDEARKLI